MKRAWRWARGERIEVFEDPAGEALIANLPLNRQQSDVFAAAGRTVADTQDPESIEDEEFLLFYDNLFLSPRLLRRFMRELRVPKGGASAALRLVLVNGSFTYLTGFADEQPQIDLGEDGTGSAYGLWWVRRRPGEALAELLERAEPVVVDVDERELSIPFSKRLPTMTDLTIPITDLVAIELSSWVHLWMANLYSIAIRFLALLRSPAGWARLVWSALRGFVRTRRFRLYDVGVAMLQRLVTRGRGCRIHPSAVVEACVLGNNVEIGPLSVVRGCIIGDGVNIMERSCVEGCVLGDGVLVNQGGTLKGVLAYPEAVMMFMQTGVVGRRTFLMGGFMPQDLKYQGTIRVQHRGRLVDTRLPFLGACVGHRVMVGGAVRLAPGRAFPNDIQLLTEPGDRIEHVPDDLPKDQFLLVRNGQFEVWRPEREATDDPPE
jgi:hypothetical protein